MANFQDNATLTGNCVGCEKITGEKACMSEAIKPQIQHGWLWIIGCLKLFNLHVFCTLSSCSYNEKVTGQNEKILAFYIFILDCKPLPKEMILGYMCLQSLITWCLDPF